MKQIIIQLWQRVLKHRKKLIYSALAFFVCQFCFFNLNWIWLEDQVYAADSQTETPSQSDSLEIQVNSWFQNTAFLRKVIYVLLYPILIVAGKLIDNSFVYGEIFNFDAVLWQMWVMSRNLADYALWFIFIFYIFKYIINQDSKNWPKWIISRALIAGVWIQASWFVMAALLDISTILTYSIWWLPMTVLETKWDDSDKYNPYILKRLFSVDVKNFEDYKLYLTNTTWDSKIYIAPCKTFDVGSEELIISPSTIYYNSWSWMPLTENTMCHIDGNVYHFSELLVDKPTCSVSDCVQNQNKYLDDLKNVIAELQKDKSRIQAEINAGRILQISPWVSSFDNPNNGYWLDPTNKKIWNKTGRLGDLLEDGSYVWAFTSLYAALMSSWERVIPQEMWPFAKFLNVALSFCHLIAIAIPLFAAVVVFMMRIGILWAAIIMSPFIALFTAFDFKVFKEGNMSYFSLNKLIPIIFSPVIICFAVSLSTVLVNIIAGIDIETEGIMDKEILWWLIKLNIWGLSLWFGKLVVSVIWVAITWFLMWAAIQSTKLWDLDIVKGIKKLATNAMWAMPIIPVVWKWADWKLTTKFVWTRAAFWWEGEQWIISKYADAQLKTYNDADSKIVNDIVNPEWVQERRKNAEAKVEHQKIHDYIVGVTAADAVSEGVDWRTKEFAWTTFNSLSTDWKEQIINAINSQLLPDERGKYNVWDIDIWNNKVYTFKNGRYELKEQATK